MKLLNEYVEKKLVIKNGTWYTYQVNGKLVKLQKTKANESLIKLKEAGKLETLEPVTQKPGDKPVKKKSQGSKTEKLNNQESNSKYSKFLGLVKDVKPNSDATKLTIYINGIDTRDVNHPMIAKCPLTFRWMLKADTVVNNSKGTSINKGWVVISKEALKGTDIEITTEADHTPEDDSYTVGDLIMCCQDNEYYRKKKAKEVISNSMRIAVSKEQRNEFSKAQTKNPDINAVNANYTGETNKANKVQTESMAQSGMSAQQIQENLETMVDMDPEKALSALSSVKASANDF